MLRLFYITKFMKYIFHCYGHPHVKAKHIRTIEFTKDADLTERGDCIIGIKADFVKEELQKLRGKIRITVEVAGKSDTFRAVINPHFNSDHEVVFRKSLYPSDRTLGHFLNKGANRLDREIVHLMQHPETQMTVTLQESRDLQNVEHEK